MELIHIDYLTIESKAKEKDINILVVMDHFTCYAQAFVTSSQTAAVVANTLWEWFFIHYGFPEKISDQGRKFESSLIAEFCKITQVKKIKNDSLQTRGKCFLWMVQLYTNIDDWHSSWRS